MIKVLAWDTSQKSGMLLAFELDPLHKILPKILSEWTFNAEAFHSERLLWAIDQTLKSVGWTLKDIDVFGVGLGPGSFTGLRIGVTTARTLAHSLRKPLYGFSSLSAFAYDALSVLEHLNDFKNTIVITSIEGAKGQLFIQIGRADWCLSKNPLIHKELVELPLEAEKVPQLLKEYKVKMNLQKIRNIIYLGPSWNTLKKKKSVASFLSLKISAQGVVAFIKKALLEKKEGDPLLVVPRYLRASYAEVQRKNQHPKTPASSIAILIEDC